MGQASRRDVSIDWPNEPPGANSCHASRGRLESFSVAAVAQPGCWQAPSQAGSLRCLQNKAKQSYA
jgi:hypothetical protein